MDQYSLSSHSMALHVGNISQRNQLKGSAQRPLVREAKLQSLLHKEGEKDII